MKTILVTPSYAPDFHRAQLLVDSVSRCVTGIDEHLLLVDNSDFQLFSSLRGPKTQLVAKESLLPMWLEKMPFKKNWWSSGRSLPVRGWITQQMAKLAIAEHFDADLIIFADSDVVFVREFDAQDMLQGSGEDTRVRMYRDERKPHFYTDRRYKNWYRFAARKLGVENSSNLDGAYIAQLTSWHRGTVLKLLEHLEQKNSCSWQKVIARSWDLSEYVLYGIFVEQVLKSEHPHYFDDGLLCHSSWYYDIDDREALKNYFGSIADQQVAIHLQSNLGIDTNDYRSLLQQFSAS